MIYLDLFLGFLRVGCFAFGGSYGAIPLIRDVVLSYGWLTEDSLTNMIAVSESTPGPIMVNLATYVGSIQGGILGAILATFAVVLPSFVIILLVFAALKAVWAHPVTQADPLQPLRHRRCCGLAGGGAHRGACRRALRRQAPFQAQCLPHRPDPPGGGTGRGGLWVLGAGRSEIDPYRCTNPYKKTAPLGAVLHFN